MKLSISNIAWQLEEEQTISQILERFNVTGVEIAPTKIFKNPLQVTLAEVEDYKNFWHCRGIDIVAMQSLLFGRPDLTIFENADKRNETFSYLSSLIQLGSKLGVKVLVFGAPKNRKIGNLDPHKAEEIALDFFYGLGEIAKQYGMIFCIEPNPQVYECDFINTSQEGYLLVTKANSQGLGLHLDAAAITLTQESIESCLENTFSHLCHFHISEPYLNLIGSGGVDHQLFGQVLSKLDYQGWVSIEMIPKSQTDNLLNVTQALETATQYYILS